jgi:ATP-dependent DNA helicase RecQ
VVEGLYRLLCRFPVEEIEVPLKELGRQLPLDRVSEMMVASALKLLDKAGHIERGTLREGTARATLQTTAVELRKTHFRGPLQQAVIDHLVYGLEAEKERTIQLDLEEMSFLLGLEVEQVRRTLASLEEAGHLVYTPPFRGRGIRVLERVDAGKLRINFAEVERRAAFERRKLRQMVDYAYCRQCLRHFILAYFGEHHTRPHCGNCSSCRSGTTSQPLRSLTPEETLVVRKILSGVARMKGRFGKIRVAQMLTGSRQKTLLDLGLDRLSTYGILKEYSQPEVISLLDALFDSGYLAIEGSEFPLLRLTEAGRQAMLEKEAVKMDFPVELRPKPAALAPVREEPEKDSAPVYPELFESLRAWRLGLAREMALPPFRILPDRTLRQIVRHLPLSRSDLARVPGIGPQRMAQYGDQIVKLVLTFCQRWTVTPPFPRPGTGRGGFGERRKQAAAQRRLPVGKPGQPGTPTTLEVTWNWWRQGKTVEKIAELRQLSAGTVIDHLVELCQQGRIHDLDRVVPAPRRGQIEAALRQFGPGPLKPVKDALPSGFSYAEIRLVAAVFRWIRNP